MTPLFTTRRSAAEFQSVLDGSAVGDVAENFALLVSTVGLMRDQVAAPTARPEFVADLRTRLLMVADAVLAPADPLLTARLTLPQRQPTPQRQRRFAAAAAAIVMVGGTAGMAAAAQGALPGDPLYPIKRTIERVEAGFRTNDSSKGAGLLAQADTRLAEVKKLLAAGDVSQLSATLDDFRTSAGNGADLLFVSYQRDGNAADITKVRDFAASKMDVLGELGKPSGESAGAFTAAVDLLADIDQQARVLCGTCGGDALSLPDQLIALSSAKTLSTLLTAPVDQAQIDAALAALARLEAVGTPDAGADGNSPGAGTLTTGPLPGGITTPIPLPNVSQSPTVITRVVADATEPVQDLLEGLTGTSGLGTTLDGLLP